MDITRSVDVAAVLRDQFAAFEAINSDIKLHRDRQRRMLLIAHDDWDRWSGFMAGGPLPAEPLPPVMLRRLATATYRLACLVDRRSAAP